MAREKGQGREGTVRAGQGMEGTVAGARLGRHDRRGRAR